MLKAVIISDAKNKIANLIIIATNSGSARVSANVFANFFSNNSATANIKVIHKMQLITTKTVNECIPHILTSYIINGDNPINIVIVRMITIKIVNEYIVLLDNDIVIELESNEYCNHLNHINMVEIVFKTYNTFRIIL